MQRTRKKKTGFRTNPVGKLVKRYPNKIEWDLDPNGPKLLLRSSYFESSGFFGVCSSVGPRTVGDFLDGLGELVRWGFGSFLVHLRVC